MITSSLVFKTEIQMGGGGGGGRGSGKEPESLKVASQKNELKKEISKSWIPE